MDCPICITGRVDRFGVCPSCEAMLYRIESLAEAERQGGGSGYDPPPEPTVSADGWPLHGPGCSCARCDVDPGPSDETQLSLDAYVQLQELDALARSSEISHQEWADVHGPWCVQCGQAGAAITSDGVCVFCLHETNPVPYIGQAPDHSSDEDDLPF